MIQRNLDKNLIQSFKALVLLYFLTRSFTIFISCLYDLFHRILIIECIYLHNFPLFNIRIFYWDFSKLPIFCGITKNRQHYYRPQNRSRVYSK